jgi:hypothetical protein
MSNHDMMLLSLQLAFMPAVGLLASEARRSETANRAIATELHVSG